nr:MAG TPA: hypothetical protein [Bacteriophage sp.]
MSCSKYCRIISSSRQMSYYCCCCNWTGYTFR